LFSQTQTKSNEQKLFGKMLDSEEKKGMVHRVVKQIVLKNRDVVGAGCIKVSDGKVLMNEVEVKEMWRAYIEILLNEEFEWDKESLEKIDKVSGSAELITYGEVEAAITKAKSGKAEGPSGVGAEMLKASVMLL
jgi:hypothetical protein